MHTTVRMRIELQEHLLSPPPPHLFHSVMLKSYNTYCPSTGWKREFVAFVRRKIQCYKYSANENNRRDSASAVDCGPFAQGFHDSSPNTCPCEAVKEALRGGSQWPRKKDISTFASKVQTRTNAARLSQPWDESQRKERSDGVVRKPKEIGYTCVSSTNR